MDEEQAVLQVNEAFYDAFGNADFAAMVEAWAHDDDVACIHPGWNVLTGYHDVIESWRAILEGGTAPQILCHEARVFVHGDTALVTCNEVVNGGLLVAMNLFIRKSGTWAMVHHHAGPCAMTESPAESAPTGSVH